MNTPLVFKAKPPEAKQVEYDLEGNVELVWLKVDQDTQQREVIAAFNDAKGLFRLSDKKQRPDPKKLERDLEVFIRRNEGETYRQITEWLNDTYNEVYNTEDAKRIFKRIKRKLD